MASIRQAAALTLAATFATGCTLHRLPRPSVPSCAPASAAELWSCIESVPREDRPESAFASTLRAANPTRKSKDQQLRSACEGSTPPGFERVENLSMGAGRAPLFAFLAAPRDDASPIVIVVHGMFDSKNTKYVRLTGELLRDEGFGVVIPDMRWHGCLLTKQWLPALGTEEGPDLVAWGRWLTSRYPGHPVGLVGFSLGGTSVLHAMGEAEASDVFRAGAVAVTPAAALPSAVAYLDAKLYFADAGFTTLFRSGFRSYLRKRTRDLGLPSDTDRPFEAFLGWLAESMATSPRELYARADPAPSVARARRPLLILETANDPLIPAAAPEALERAAEGNPDARLIQTPFGGHIGQPGSSPGWFASVLAAFFRYGPRISAGRLPERELHAPGP